VINIIFIIIDILVVTLFLFVTNTIYNNDKFLKISQILFKIMTKF